MTEPAFDAIENLLARAIGLDPSVIGLTMIRRAVDHRKCALRELTIQGPTPRRPATRPRTSRR